MKIRFVGTGAADWFAPVDTGEYRRYTSTLFDDTLLIDFSGTALDLIDEKKPISDILITHSHNDHFQPEAIGRLAPARLYAHESWANDIAIADIETIPLTIGKTYDIAGFSVIPMPANHTTTRQGETTLHYLLTKGGKSVLYAVDGAWLLKQEIALLEGYTLDALIIDATIGDGHEGDYRIFEHNSLEMIRIISDTLYKTQKLRPCAPIYLTHMARTLHMSQYEMERFIKPPFVPCYDGMEVEI